MQAARSLFQICLNFALDGLLAALAVPVARWIAAPGGDIAHPLWLLPAGAAALLLAGGPFGLSRQYWRFAGLEDLWSVATSSMVGAALFAVLMLVTGLPFANPTLPVIHALTLLVLLGLPRVFYGRMRMGRTTGSGGSDKPSVLLVGSAEDADVFLRALARDRRKAFTVEGLLTPAARLTGRRIQGHPILGAVADIGDVLERLRAEGRLPEALVVAATEPSSTFLQPIIEQANRFGLLIRRAPGPMALDTQMVADKAGMLELKPVAIEDLLNRPQVPLDRDGMARLIQGRRVVVTGAGGTIGSELVRQLAAFGPSMLVLVDNGEYALWQIDLELAESHPAVPRRTVIADIRDEARIRSLFEECCPELLFHAAALKHVPMVEANPAEGLLTNAIGTRIVADAARAVGALAMVLISTDKAVNPSSVMGASKRLAEMYCQALDVQASASGRGMRCITVRFGNVLGSTGSVVPLFQHQLARGGPLTVTHPDMRRYFMTVREAVGLVLQASVLRAADSGLAFGRDGGIFVLDMGEPVKIVDLARQMIRLAGLRPDIDVEVRFTGLRPGEKLFEELFHGKEPPSPIGHPGLLMATPRTADLAMIGRALDEVGAACRGAQPRMAVALLGRLIPEFEHNANGASDGARA